MGFIVHRVSSATKGHDEACFYSTRYQRIVVSNLSIGIRVRLYLDAGREASLSFDVRGNLNRKSLMALRAEGTRVHRNRYATLHYA